MKYDEREDSYDQLLILARDASDSKKRTNRWTTGLIVTAMAGSGVYVGTVNQQLDALNTANDTAEAKIQELTNIVNAAEGERDALRAQRDIYIDLATSFGEMYPILKLAESLPDTINIGGIDDDRESGGTQTTTQFALSNVVWVVDGSRRLPMTDGDILWIPEGRFWIRKSTRESDGANILTKHTSIPTGPQPVGEELTLPFQTTSLSGSFNCLEINMHPRSNRPVFINDPKYVDVEVMYSRNENCRP